MSSTNFKEFFKQLTEKTRSIKLIGTGDSNAPPSMFEYSKFTTTQIQQTTVSTQNLDDYKFVNPQDYLKAWKARNHKQILELSNLIDSLMHKGVHSVELKNEPYPWQPEAINVVTENLKKNGYAISITNSNDNSSTHISWYVPIQIA